MYSITVKIDGVESRRRSAGLLHIVIGFFLIAKGADFYRLTEYSNFLPVLPVLLIAGTSMFYGFFRRKVDLFARYNTRLRGLQILAFLYLGAMYIKSGNPIDYIGVFIFAFLALLLLVSERRVFQETIITINDEGVRIPGYYKDYLIFWQELESVTVREDFVTFFHVKKKYLQYQVMQDLSTLEVTKLNAYCSEMIEKKQAVEKAM